MTRGLRNSARVAACSGHCVQIGCSQVHTYQTGVFTCHVCSSRGDGDVCLEFRWFVLFWCLLRFLPQALTVFFWFRREEGLSDLFPPFECPLFHLFGCSLTSPRSRQTMHETNETDRGVCTCFRGAHGFSREHSPISSNSDCGMTHACMPAVMMAERVRWCPPCARLVLLFFCFCPAVLFEKVYEKLTEAELEKLWREARKQKKNSR